MKVIDKAQHILRALKMMNISHALIVRHQSTESPLTR
jgi:hypothetical protein